MRVLTCKLRSDSKLFTSSLPSSQVRNLHKFDAQEDVQKPSPNLLKRQEKALVLQSAFHRLLIRNFICPDTHHSLDLETQL